MFGEYFYKISGIFFSECLLFLCLTVVCVSGSISNFCLVTKVVLSLIVDMEDCCNANNGKQKQLY